MWPRLGVLATIMLVALILAVLALLGPVEEPVGRRMRFVAAILNPVIDLVGSFGAAAVFAGCGILASLAFLVLARRY